jgi:serine/threonine protein kinase
MAIATTSQAEPIPGYRLLERLGQGGFGEVWKAEAPGGLFKAVKIVYGSLHGDCDEEQRVRQELKALERVKTVRHPYILSLERYEIVEGRLVIVMELADRNLWDRFKECQGQGLPGIPRDELLGYMEEAAEALDLMNGQFQLQHLDIKPQNLFLLYNHVKVGDFGLVKDLEGMWARATSGVTPLYAAPETFDGLVSRFSDQYNLAIVYQELLTGQLPFAGTNCRQLMLQHLTGDPNLTPLSPDDQAAVARALAKKPEERHASCGDLVRALRRGQGHASGAAQAPGADGESVRSSPSPAHGPATVLLRKKGDGSRSGETKHDALPSAETNSKPPPPEPPEITGDGVLFPALVVGLGGVGLAVLRQLRTALHKRCGPAAALPHIHLLQLDSDPEAIEEGRQGEPDTVLREDDLLLTPLPRRAVFMKSGREREAVEQWLPLTMLTHLPRDQTTPDGLRALGRLAFTSSRQAIGARLQAKLQACTDPQALAAAQTQTGLGLRSNRPRVYVVTSLGGGTGSGMYLDVAYTARRLLQQMGYRRPDVVGLFLLPAGGRGAAAPRAVANAFAALTELHHFASPDVTFTASYPAPTETLADAEPPFSRCILLPLPADAAGDESLRELTSLAGDFLSRDLVTPLGRTADLGRARLPSPSPGLACQTFGAYWFAVPRRALLQRVAQRLCQRLVRGWRVADPKARDTALRAWVTEQLAHWELSPECLAERLQTACAPPLGPKPEAACDAVLARHAAGGPGELGRKPEAAAATLADIEQLVGSPREDAPGTSECALHSALDKSAEALSVAAENQLAELALSALAEPQLRLTGADEDVQRHLAAGLAEEARRQDALGQDLLRQAADTHRQIAPLLQDLHKRSLFWSKSKARAGAALVELLRLYHRTRCQGLVHQQVSAVYRGLKDNLHKYHREVGCCRRRIDQFLQSIEEPAANQQAEEDLGLGQYLLPARCRTLDEAAEWILASMTADDLRDLNQTVLGMMRGRLEAQVHVCTAPAGFFKELAGAVYEHVAAFADAPLGRAHTAEMYMEQHADGEDALADLASAFEEAVPELANARLTPGQELCVLAVPPGPEGTLFRKLVERALPDRELAAAASTDDIVFYREQPQVALESLPQLGPAAREAYQQLLAGGPHGTPHSRIDIVHWLPPT